MTALDHRLVDRRQLLKSAIAGWGAAPKEQVQKMVQARLHLTRPPQPADAADAAALALCHLATAPFSARVASSGGTSRSPAGVTLSSEPRR